MGCGASTPNPAAAGPHSEPAAARPTPPQAPPAPSPVQGPTKHAPPASRATPAVSGLQPAAPPPAATPPAARPPSVKAGGAEDANANKDDFEDAPAPEKPKERSKTRLIEWTVEHVAQWVREEVQLPAYVEVFVQNSVDGRSLVELGEAELEKDLGIARNLHRKKFLREIDILRGLPAGMGVRGLRGARDCFISYSHSDTPFVLKLKSDLVRDGLSCWIDSQQLQSGHDWRDEIASAIASSRVLVLCISPKAAGSQYCREEWNMGYDLQKRLFPVFLVPPDAIQLRSGDEMMIKRFQWTIFNAQREYDDVLRELVAGIKRTIEEERANAPAEGGEDRAPPPKRFHVPGAVSQAANTANDDAADAAAAHADLAPPEPAEAKPNKPDPEPEGAAGGVRVTELAPNDPLYVELQEMALEHVRALAAAAAAADEAAAGQAVGYTASMVRKWRSQPDKNFLLILVKEGAVGRVLEIMRAHEEASELQMDACEILADVASVDEACRELALDSGALDCTLRVMQMHFAEPEIQESACRALMHFAHSEGRHSALVEAGVVREVAATMAQYPRNLRVQEYGCGLVRQIAGTESTRAAAVELGAASHIAKALLAHEVSAEMDGAALGALLLLSSVPAFPDAFARAGGPRALAECAARRAEDGALVAAATALAAALAADEASRQGLQEAGLVPAAFAGLRAFPRSPPLFAAAVSFLALMTDEVRSAQVLASGGKAVVDVCIHDAVTGDRPRLLLDALAGHAGAAAEAAAPFARLVRNVVQSEIGARCAEAPALLLAALQAVPRHEADEALRGAAAAAFRAFVARDAAAAASPEILAWLLAEAARKGSLEAMAELAAEALALFAAGGERAALLARALKKADTLALAAQAVQACKLHPGSLPLLQGTLWAFRAWLAQGLLPVDEMVRAGVLQRAVDAQKRFGADPGLARGFVSLAAALVDDGSSEARVALLRSGCVPPLCAVYTAVFPAASPDSDAVLSVLARVAAHDESTGYFAGAALTRKAVQEAHEARQRAREAQKAEEEERLKGEEEARRRAIEEAARRQREMEEERAARERATQGPRGLKKQGGPTAGAAGEGEGEGEHPVAIAWDQRDGRHGPNLTFSNPCDVECGNGPSTVVSHRAIAAGVLRAVVVVGGTNTRFFVGAMDGASPPLDTEPAADDKQNLFKSKGTHWSGGGMQEFEYKKGDAVVVTLNADDCTLRLECRGQVLTTTFKRKPTVVLGVTFYKGGKCSIRSTAAVAPVPKGDEMYKLTREQLVGATVKRGKDWKWKDQDGGDGKTGRVAGLSTGLWVKVEWDSGGSSNSYRWGDDDCYDLAVVALAANIGEPDTPSASASGVGTSELLKATVMRAKDWAWGAQDGGAGNLGVVVETDVEGEDWIKVKWAKSSEENLYRWGEEGKYDVKVVHFADGRSPLTPAEVVGATVVRGKDWKWDNQDGGSGKTGVVSGVSNTAGWISVTWDEGEQGKRYRWGDEKCYDVRITDMVAAIAQAEAAAPPSANAIFDPLARGSGVSIERGVVAKCSSGPGAAVLASPLLWGKRRIRFRVEGGAFFYVGALAPQEIPLNAEPEKKQAPSLFTTSAQSSALGGLLRPRTFEHDSASGTTLLATLEPDTCRVELRILRGPDGTQSEKDPVLRGTFDVPVETHSGVECKHCSTAIRGERYKCGVCEKPEIDVCGECQALGKHAADHILIRTQASSGKFGVTLFVVMQAGNTCTILGEEGEMDASTMYKLPRSKVIGATVTRGKDWKWGNQDGGAGSRGVIRQADSSDGWVRVQWANGGRNGYRWGAESSYDLAVVQLGGAAAPASAPLAADEALQFVGKYEQRGNSVSLGPKNAARCSSGPGAAVVSGPLTHGTRTIRFSVSGAATFLVGVVRPGDVPVNGLPAGDLERWFTTKEQAGERAADYEGRVVPHDQRTFATARFSAEDGRVELRIHAGPNGAPTSSDAILLGTTALQKEVHGGITCDGCKKKPIEGPRFKCPTCSDFDLCKSCHDAKKHPQHVLYRAKPAREGLVLCFVLHAGNRVELLGESSDLGGLDMYQLSREQILGGTVVRGRDWKWKEQDGGPGVRGTVTEVDKDPGWVRVHWPSSASNTYRWGKDGFYDLSVVELASHVKREHAQ